MEEQVATKDNLTAHASCRKNASIMIIRRSMPVEQRLDVEHHACSTFNVQHPKPGHKYASGGCNWRAETGMDGDLATGTRVLEPEQVIIIQKLASIPG